MTTVYVDRYGVKHVTPYSFNYRIIKKEEIDSRGRKAYKDGQERKKKNVGKIR